MSPGVGALVRVLVSVAVVWTRSLVVPRWGRSRSASAVNGVVTGWGRSRSSCLVLDNLALGCRTVAHAESPGAVSDGLCVWEQRKAGQAHSRRARLIHALSRQRSVLLIAMMEVSNHQLFLVATALDLHNRLCILLRRLRFSQCSPPVLVLCHAARLWSVAASWPTSHPLRHPPLDLLLQLLSLLRLSLRPQLNLDLLLTQMSFPFPNNNVRVKCKTATVAPSICLYWEAWSSLLPSSPTFTGNTAKLT